MIAGGSTCAVFLVQEYTMLRASALIGSADLSISNSWTLSVVRYAHVMDGEVTAVSGEESAVRQKSSSNGVECDQVEQREGSEMW